jgi:hypothetical protein
VPLTPECPDYLSLHLQLRQNGAEVMKILRPFLETPELLGLPSLASSDALISASQGLLQGLPLADTQALAQKLKYPLIFYTPHLVNDERVLRPYLYTPLSYDNPERRACIAHLWAKQLYLLGKPGSHLHLDKSRLVADQGKIVTGTLSLEKEIAYDGDHYLPCLGKTIEGDTWEIHADNVISKLGSIDVKHLWLDVLNQYYSSGVTKANTLVMDVKQVTLDREQREWTVTYTVETTTKTKNSFGHSKKKSHSDSHTVILKESYPAHLSGLLAFEKFISAQEDATALFPERKEGRDLTSKGMAVDLFATLVTPGSGGSLTFLQQAKKQVIRASIRAGLNVAILGEKPKHALKEAVKYAAVNTVAAYTAGKIGQAYKSGYGPLDPVSHKLLHGGIGALTGALMDLKGDSLRSAASGALGAIVAETVADVLTRQPHEALIDMMREAKAEGKELTKEQYLKAYQDEVYRNMDIGRLCAGIAAVLTRSNASLSVMTATNALENNFITAIRLAATLTPKMLASMGVTGISAYQLGQWLKDQPFARDMLPEGVLWEDPGFMPEESKAEILITPRHENKPLILHTPIADPYAWILQTPIYDGPNTSILFKEKGSLERPLLQGEGKVGSFGQLRKNFEVPGDNLSAHHIPNDQYMRAKGINRNAGVAIMIEDPNPGVGGRHREIHKQLKRQDLGLAPRDALAQGIWRAREVYKQDRVYTSEIREALQTVVQQNKEQHPTLFQKDGEKK